MKTQTQTVRKPITATSAKDYQDKILQIARKQQLTLKSGNKEIQVPIRIPQNGQCVIIDAINFVTSISVYDHTQSPKDEDYFDSIIYNPEISQEEKDALAEEIAFNVSEQLGNVLGSRFTNLIKNVKGLHGYKYQYTIGDDDYVLGKVCFGGNKSTVLIMVTGKGCYEAMDLWENNLYDFLNEAEKGRITRIDLALDDFDGAFSSAEQADQADSDNKFSLTNRQPKVQHLGDWKRHDGEGRTLQVGKRENGKMYRGYEKGKQLGDPESPWFRSEIEFKNKDRHLPLEMLLHPTDYFAGAYPYALELVEHKNPQIFETAEKIQTMQKESDITFHKAVSVMKKQFGKYIKTFRDLIPDQIDGKSKDTIIIELIETDKVHDYIPKRLRITDSYFQKLIAKAEAVNQCNHSPLLKGA